MERIERVNDAGDRGDASLAAWLKAMHERIERACAHAGRNPDDVTILAVTKGFGPEAIQAALAANIADIGENYFQEAQAKFAGVAWPATPSRRHFIGHIQGNKARKIAELFDVVQTVGDARLVAALDRGAQATGKMLDVLIQANVASDDRTGAQPGDIDSLAAEIDKHSHLRLRGVMAVGPLDEAQAPTAFAAAARIFKNLSASRPQVDTLSLGMTADLEPAIAAGSTLVRLGTGLFGPRKG